MRDARVVPWDCWTYLGLSVLAIIVGDSYFVEQTVELVDDAVHLLGQVTSVHLGRFHGGRFQTKRTEKGSRRVEDKRTNAVKAAKGRIKVGASDRELPVAVDFGSRANSFASAGRDVGGFTQDTGARWTSTQKRSPCGGMNALHEARDSEKVRRVQEAERKRVALPSPGELDRKKIMRKSCDGIADTFVGERPVLP